MATASHIVPIVCHLVDYIFLNSVIYSTRHVTVAFIIGYAYMLLNFVYVKSTGTLLYFEGFMTWEEDKPIKGYVVPLVGCPILYSLIFILMSKLTNFKLKKMGFEDYELKKVLIIELT